VIAGSAGADTVTAAACCSWYHPRPAAGARVSTEKPGQFGQRRARPLWDDDGPARAGVHEGPVVCGRQLRVLDARGW